jgi:hypothetical protein
MLLGAEMSSRIGLPFLIFLTLPGAAEKKLPIDQTSNDVLEVSATPIIDKDQIRQELGSDLGGDIVVVRVQLRPVSDKPVKVSLDDFLLVSTKDGQRALPYAPSQIAGDMALVLTPQGARNAGIGANKGPRWSGGAGPLGFPGGGVGNTAGTSTVDTKVETVHSDKPNPLLAVLKDKVLQEKETNEPISGLLYFQMIGKLKAKDLELHYKGPAGQMALRFRP